MTAVLLGRHRRSRMRFVLIFWALTLFAAASQAQHPVGMFDDHMDIGNPKLAGDASYDEATQSYDIKGAGDNIWFNHDEYQFVYKKMKGDFILTADFAFTGDTTGVVGHRKIGWMIRESTDPGAASANACKHIDGLVVLQWRPYKGMNVRIDVPVIVPYIGNPHLVQATTKEV